MERLHFGKSDRLSLSKGDRRKSAQTQARIYSTEISNSISNRVVASWALITSCCTDIFLRLPSLGTIGGFPCSSVSRESPCNARDVGSIPGSGRSPGEENGNPLQFSCLENPKDRGGWQVTIYGITRVGHNSSITERWAL